MESIPNKNENTVVDRKEFHDSFSRFKRISFTSLPVLWFKQAVRPILSLKQMRPTKGSVGMMLFFLVKVAALEALRRATRTKFPQLWWGLQAVPFLQTPGLNWLKRWAPFRVLMRETQVFSKPIVFLSLATTISNVFEEIKEEKDATTLARVLSLDDSSRANGNMDDPPETTEVQSNNAQSLCQELEKEDIDIPTRFNKDELESFLIAANGNISASLARLKKTIRWRETYYFLSTSELRNWLHLVFWHGHDIKLRPTLIIRLGIASSTLHSHQRPQFVQAIVSQVEYGILNLLHPNDPRITVLVDCIGVSINGFPMHLMRSCCILFTEHYPLRLAALVAVNVPDTLGDAANTIMKILEPATREKISLAGEDYALVLDGIIGGLSRISMCLVGQCGCRICEEALMLKDEQERSLNSRASTARNSADFEREHVYPGDQLTSYQSCTAVLRMIIISFLIFWVFVALVFGLHDFKSEALPT